MKIFKYHWNAIFDYLPAWQSLSLDTREMFATKIDNNLSTPPHFFGEDGIEELKKAGFTKGDANRLTPEARSFRRAISAMYRFNLYDYASPHIAAYVRDHLTNYEKQGITGSRSYGSDLTGRISQMATDKSWLQDLLHAQSIAKWERQYTNYSSEECLADPNAFELLKLIIRQLIDGDNPIPLNDLAPAQGYDADTISNALMGGVRYLFLFPALNRETLEPVIGIHPNIHERLNRGVTEMPQPAQEEPEAIATLDTPFIVYDMTTVLVNSVPDGLRIRQNDNSLFKRDKQRLTSAIATLPENFNRAPSRDSRIKEARLWLQRLYWMEAAPDADGRLRLRAAEDAQEWLSMTLRDKLKFLLDEMRDDYQTHGEEEEYLGSETIAFAPLRILRRTWTAEEAIDTYAEIAAAFTGFKVGEWVPFAEFIRWQTETANPLLGSKDVFDRGFFHPPTDTEKEEIWFECLSQFIEKRLQALGCIKFVIDRNEKAWFSLTPVGAYFLGTTDDFEYETGKSGGTILVQPNFEIVFTAADPGAEAEIAHYAERIGNGVGSIFRLTRQSVNAANDCGIGGEDIVERLSRRTDKDLPRNVVTQIKDWSNAYRRISSRRIHVLECPDSETALRVQSMLSNSVRPISDTILEFTKPKAMKKAQKKLKESGIGLQFPK